MRSLISTLAALSQRVSRSMFAGSFNAGSPRSRTQYMIASIVVCGVATRICALSDEPGKSMSSSELFSIDLGHDLSVPVTVSA
jgi:hypothetical protein